MVYTIADGSSKDILVGDVVQVMQGILPAFATVWFPVTDVSRQDIIQITVQSQIIELSPNVVLSQWRKQ